MNQPAPLRWRKSARSGSESNCVEIPHTFDRVRDSKNDAVELMVSQAGWSAFMAAAKSDGFAAN
jgi:hypothetical protein